MAFNITEMNFAQIAEEGFGFELKNPLKGDGLEAYITVRGKLSPKMKKYNKSVFNKLQAKEIQNKKRGKDDRLDLEEAEQMQREAALARIISWKGIEIEKGKELGNTEAEFKEVLMNPDNSWIVEQIIEESDNSANFS